MLNSDPEQRVVSLLATTTGNAFIVTVTESVFVHPLPSVPVTLYLVVDAGLTE